MCQAISGVAVKTNEAIKVYTLRHDDSHSAIRKEYHIRDDGGAGDRQTPVELVPVRGLTDVDDMDFRFDVGRPNWWTDEMTDSAIRQLHRAWMKRFVDGQIVMEGNLDLRSVTTLPEGFAPHVGDWLDLGRVTTLPEDHNIKCARIYLGDGKGWRELEDS